MQRSEEPRSSTSFRWELRAEELPGADDGADDDEEAETKLTDSFSPTSGERPAKSSISFPTRSAIGPLLRMTGDDAISYAPAFRTRRPAPGQPSRRRAVETCALNVLTLVRGSSTNGTLNTPCGCCLAPARRLGGTQVRVARIALSGLSGEPAVRGPFPSGRWRRCTHLTPEHLALSWR